METASRIKAQLAYGSRQGSRYTTEHLATLRRDYHAARLAENIRRVVQESGPFTPEQSRELAGILTGSAAEVAA